MFTWYDLYKHLSKLLQKNPSELNKPVQIDLLGCPILVTSVDDVLETLIEGGSRAYYVLSVRDVSALIAMLEQYKEQGGDAIHLLKARSRKLD